MVERASSCCAVASCTAPDSIHATCGRVGRLGASPERLYIVVNRLQKVLEWVNPKLAVVATEIAALAELAQGRMHRQA